MPALIDLTGQRFERLLVFCRFDHNPNSPAIRWLCRCDCGTFVRVTAGNLKSGDCKSCGCLRQERSIKYYVKGRQKSVYKTPEYSSWQQMKRRCLNPRHRMYYRYGGRGIAVCQEWLDSFAAFYEHIGPMPGPKYTLERKDSNGNYEPGNVKWATRKEQANNTAWNHPLTFRGETRNLGEWATLLGIKYNTLHNRIVDGWSIEKALSTPVNKKFSHPPNSREFLSVV